MSAWIQWKGGPSSKCPVAPGTKGYLKFRCEIDDEKIVRGLPYDISIYRWNDTGRREDIIAYCIANGGTDG